MVIWHFIARVGIEDIFKPAVVNETSHETGYDNEVGLVNLNTSKKW
jgi:hypothetical protein